MPVNIYPGVDDAGPRKTNRNRRSEVESLGSDGTILAAKGQGPARPAATILVVDDDAGIRALLRYLLEAAGYQVFEAAEGGEALIQAETHRVDLVITDLIMPGKEGIETIGLLHNQQPNLKIIAMSGAMESAFLAAAGHLGAQATLAKPFTKEQLLQTVHRVLTQ